MVKDSLAEDNNLFQRGLSRSSGGSNSQFFRGGRSRPFPRELPTWGRPEQNFKAPEDTNRSGTTNSQRPSKDNMYPCTYKKRTLCIAYGGQSMGTLKQLTPDRVSIHVFNVI